MLRAFQRAEAFAWAGVLIAAGAILLVRGQGIPEPGLVLYGSVSNWNAAALNSSLVWTNRSGGETVAVAATWIVVNGEAFYAALVPFETRFAGTPQALASTPNTFALSVSPAAFSRQAALNGRPVDFARPEQAAYTFGAADRGRLDRVDLVLREAPGAFEEWIARFAGIPAHLRSADGDADGDGADNRREFLAGTDPSDPASVFRMESGWRPEVTPEGFAGIVIEWSSVSGGRYVVERSSDLGRAFTRVGEPVPGSGLRTSIRDPEARGPGPFFYRIQLDERPGGPGE